MKETQHFCFLLVEEFTHIAFSCAVEPLRIANLLSGEELYTWSFASEDGARARASNGAVTQVHHGYDDLPEAQRLFVLSGLHMKDHATAALRNTLRRQKRHGVRVGALCSGAWLLAEAGLLDGMKAAIHWDYHDSFMEEFPRVELVRNVFVADEALVTASGGTATADLMLYLIEHDHGEALARDVADQMVYNAVREGSAAQRVSLQARSGMRSPKLMAAVDLMTAAIERPLSGAEIAAAIGISTRQLERLFSQHLSTSPKKYYMELRLERARRLLVQTEQSVMQVALACGFESAGHFSRVFKAAYGISPLQQRSKLG